MCTTTASDPARRRLARATAVGFTIGLLPAPWGATPLAFLLGLILRLNPIAVQAANYAAWPLQLVLMPLFFLAGDRLFGSGSLQLETLSTAMHGPYSALAAELAMAQLAALLLWALCAPFCIALVLTAGNRCCHLWNSHKKGAGANAGP